MTEEAYRTYSVVTSNHKYKKCKRKCGFDSMSSRNFVDKLNSKDERVNTRLLTRGNTFFYVFRNG